METGRASEACIDDAYFQAVLTKPLHEIYRILEPHLRPPGVAVDLGCGVGHAALFLLKKGYEVHAVDISSSALDIVRDRAGESPSLHFIQADMREWAIPSSDVIVAGFSLFFLEPGTLEPLWKKVVASLKPGGLFAGQFLGVNDEWKDQNHALVDDETLRRLLVPFDLIHYEEVEQDGENVHRQPKHWHIFHVVARKR